MSCPACTPPNPCEVCATLGQELGLMLAIEPSANVSPTEPLPVQPREYYRREGQYAEPNYIINRLSGALLRTKSLGRASDLRWQIRSICQEHGIEIPQVAMKLRKGERSDLKAAMGVAA